MRIRRCSSPSDPTFPPIPSGSGAPADRTGAVLSRACPPGCRPLRCRGPFSLERRRGASRAQCVPLSSETIVRGAGRRIGRIRICGSRGRVTARGHPATSIRSERSPMASAFGNEYPLLLCRSHYETAGDEGVLHENMVVCVESYVGASGVARASSSSSRDWSPRMCRSSCRATPSRKRSCRAGSPSAVSRSRSRPLKAPFSLHSIATSCPQTSRSTPISATGSASTPRARRKRRPFRAGRARPPWQHDAPDHRRVSAERGRPGPNPARFRSTRPAVSPPGAGGRVPIVRSRVLFRT